MWSRNRPLALYACRCYEASTEVWCSSGAMLYQVKHQSNSVKHQSNMATCVGNLATARGMVARLLSKYRSWLLAVLLPARLPGGQVGKTTCTSPQDACMRNMRPPQVLRCTPIPLLQQKHPACSVGWLLSTLYEHERARMPQSGFPKVQSMCFAGLPRTSSEKDTPRVLTGQTRLQKSSRRGKTWPGGVT